MATGTEARRTNENEYLKKAVKLLYVLQKHEVTVNEGRASISQDYEYVTMENWLCEQRRGGTAR